MKRLMSKKEIQDVLLKAMLEIDNFCQKHEIIYYMIGGTLLGAIRHKGFIPWDDDIDIAMTRENYEKFFDIWESSYCGKLRLQNYRTDKSCMHTITRILIPNTKIINDGTYNVSIESPELFVDIFPLDLVPIDNKLEEKQSKQLLYLKKLLSYKFSTQASSIWKHRVKLLRKSLLCVLPYNVLEHRFDAIAKHYSQNASKYLCSMSSQYAYSKQKMPCEYYGEPQRLHFQNSDLFAPAEPELYLTQLYGEYLKLPPKEKQTCHIKVEIDN